MAIKRRIFKQDEFRETGFGNRVIEGVQRLMNKDGSSNVKRTGIRHYTLTRIYHSLITMRWWKFNLIIFSSYLMVNLIFATIYYFGDVSHVNGMIYQSESQRFMEIFFFSAQSLTTVGYGRLNPTGYFDSTVAVIESFLGLLGFALATGLLYGRFSRPVANVVFSRNALIAPYQGFTALMVRLANTNRSELIDSSATIILAYIDETDGKKIRRFSTLKLELTRVNLLTMSWTLVHPIDEESPLYGWTEDDYKKRSTEFLVLIHAYEETFAQSVHTRTSYLHDEIVFGAKFSSIIIPDDSGSVSVELNRISENEAAPLQEEILISS
jgi:inward rectifier potassium channel